MTKFPTAFIVLIVATAIAATGCSIPTLPEPQGARGPTYAPYPTFTREPTESEIEVQQAVARSVSATIEALTEPSPQPTLPRPTKRSTTLTSTRNDTFAAQRTRITPTYVATALPEVTGSIAINPGHQWIMASSTATPEQRKNHGVAGSQAVFDDEGQRYTCGIYEDGAEVPRINLAFSKDLSHTVIINQFGELQGAVNTVTTIKDVVVPVEWFTWTVRADRIRLRGEDAVFFVQQLSEQNAGQFRLDLPEDPHLSRTYDTNNLLAAMESNDMTCFGQISP